jgi:hypothetical protein
VLPSVGCSRTIWHHYRRLWCGHLQAYCFNVVMKSVQFCSVANGQRVIKRRLGCSQVGDRKTRTCASRMKVSGTSNRPCSVCNCGRQQAADARPVVRSARSSTIRLSLRSCISSSAGTHPALLCFRRAGSSSRSRPRHIIRTNKIPFFVEPLRAGADAHHSGHHGIWSVVAILPTRLVAGHCAPAAPVLADPDGDPLCLHRPYAIGQGLVAANEMDLDRRQLSFVIPGWPEFEGQSQNKIIFQI